MAPMPKTNQRLSLFVLITLGCVLFSLVYIFGAARKSGGLGAALAISSPLHNAAESPLPPEASHPRQDLQQQPHLVFINGKGAPDLGKVEMTALADQDETFVSNLKCERVYYAAKQGICLIRNVSYTSANTTAVLFGSDFQPKFTFTTDGIPSRARVSPDGRYAAFTVFVLGHSYADAQMSTATFLMDTTTGKPLANLEEFAIWQQGKLLQSPDINFWGMTFAHDSNFFYATLRTNGKIYLVHGDIKARKVTTIYENVECPSLSPDEKRIAFKKLVSRAFWRLTVLDLTTFKETPLAEVKSVDDQAEWLDNDHVLYAGVDPAPPPWMSVMVVPADGSGKPQVYASGALSPAVVR